MENRMKFAYFLMIAFFFMLVMGCSKQQVNQAGFLDNYDILGPGKKGGVNLIYLKKGVDFKKYNKIMLDHVVFFFNKDSKYKGVHPDTLKELADAFHEAVAEALEGAYPLVDTPGPDVMRVRVAITDVVPGKPGMTIVTTFVPVKTGAKVVFKAVKKVTTGEAAYVGQTSMEAEILDSLSNDLIAAAMDGRTKEKKIKLTAGFTKWGDVKGVFKFWGKRLRIWLDETHGIETKDD